LILSTLNIPHDSWRVAKYSALGNSTNNIGILWQCMTTLTLDANQSLRINWMNAVDLAFRSVDWEKFPAHTAESGTLGSAIASCGSMSLTSDTNDLGMYAEMRNTAQVRWVD
jgi:hypothetical protein